MLQNQNQPQHPTPGLFITLEGGEGAGKSTLLLFLFEALKDRGTPVLATREPGGTLLGEKVRQLLLDAHGMSIGATTELLLFLAGRAQHLEEVIIPALKSGITVICDRFNDSTIAYQGVGRALGMEYVEDLCLLACRGLQPQLTILLDIDPICGLARCVANGGTLDRIETEALAFHQSIREALLTLVAKQPSRYVVINANAPREIVAQQALAAITTKL